MNNHYVPLAVIGISHKTAAVEIREKAALDEVAQSYILPALIKEFSIDGCLIVSTCNRTEIYLSSEEAAARLPQVRLWMDQYKNCAYFSNAEYSFTANGLEAVRHFFSVIAGLDSQVLGEPQITGQVKDAYERARSLSATDIILNKMFNYGLQAEKSIRNDTFLTDGAVSISFAGVELARKIFNKLDDKYVLLIGAGEAAELAAVHFIEKGVRQIAIVNRTLAKAEELAARFNGQAFGLERLADSFHQADIVISATSSPQPVITYDFVKQMMKQRHHDPLFLIDLAIPRDIEPEINRLDDVFLYNLDDLNEVIQVNLEKRRQEIPKCEKIIEHYTADFVKWLSTHSVGATIHRLKMYFDTIRLNELDRLKKRLPQDRFSEIDYLTQSIVNKIMHQHIKALKKSAAHPERHQQQVDFMHELYELENE